MLIIHIYSICLTLLKVVQNPSINKTSKIRLFNDKTLKDLSALYYWRGPSGWKSCDALTKETEEMEVSVIFNFSYFYITLSTELTQFNFLIIGCFLLHRLRVMYRKAVRRYEKVFIRFF